MPSKQDGTTPSRQEHSDEFSEEAIPFDDVLRRLLAAKPVHRKPPEHKPADHVKQQPRSSPPTSKKRPSP
jgi:hypothetical protein